MGRDGESPALESVEVENIATEPGLFSEVRRCLLEWRDNHPLCPTTVIVKMHSSDPKTFRMGRRLRLYRREYDYYRHVAPLSPLRSPTLHWGNFANRTHRFALVLEDMSLTHQAPLSNSATPTEAQTAIRAAAHLHARYWNNVHEPHLAPFPDYLKQLRRLVQLAYLAYLPRVLSRFGDCFSGEQKRLAESYGMRIADHMDDMATGPRTFTHGDFRSANLFLEDGDGGRATAIDWQNCGMHSGLRDVTYFLSTSVSPQVRREIERDTLKEYHRALRVSGVEDYSFDDCWRDYRRVMLSCLIGPVITCGALELADASSYQTMRTGLQRTLAAVEELRADEFLPHRRRLFTVSNMFSVGSKAAYGVHKSMR